MPNSMESKLAQVIVKTGPNDWFFCQAFLALLTNADLMNFSMSRSRGKKCMKISSKMIPEMRYLSIMIPELLSEDWDDVAFPPKKEKRICKESMVFSEREDPQNDLRVESAEISTCSFALS